MSTATPTLDRSLVERLVRSALEKRLGDNGRTDGQPGRPRLVVNVQPNGRSNWSGLMATLARTLKPGQSDRERVISFSEIRMAGGTIVPLPGQNPFPLQALAFGTLVAGLGLASLVYLFFEFRRVTRREALLAESRSTALQAQ